MNRVLLVQEMGLVINPAGARIQIEGGVTRAWATPSRRRSASRTGPSRTSNFDRYRLPRFSALPKIETVIIDAPDLSPKGGGEPSIILMGALVANAVYDAVGVRMLEIPITPARVKAALAAKAVT